VEYQKFNDSWSQLPTLPRGKAPTADLFRKELGLTECLGDPWTHRTWRLKGDRVVEGDATDPIWALDAKTEAQGRVGLAFPAKDFPGTPLATRLLVRGRDWVALKRWTPGSAEVEAWLTERIGPTPRVRVAAYQGTNDAPEAPAHPDSVHQINPMELGRHRYRWTMENPGFGRDWRMTLVPGPEELEVMDRQLMLYRIRSWSLLGSLGVLFLLGFWLRVQAMRKTRRDAARMAALTHSLKTPLAILRLRCDGLRLGDPDRATLDAELIRIGQEAEQMAQSIQATLEGLRKPEAQVEETLVNAAWATDIVEELAPALEAEGRELRFESAPGAGMAAQEDLRSALLTLLENALAHGRGTIILQAGPGDGGYRFRVQDEGPRLAEAPPLLPSGSGLGLHLLTLVARREGWGFQLRTLPDGCFQAQLVVRCAD